MAKRYKPKSEYTPEQWAAKLEKRRKWLEAHPEKAHQFEATKWRRHKVKRAAAYRRWAARKVEHLTRYHQRHRVDHGDELRQQEKIWRDQHKPEIKAKNDTYRAENGALIAAKHREWYEHGGAAVKSETTAHWRGRLKRTAINHYGGQCAMCAEQELELLVLDHVNDDGAAHRRAVGRAGSRIYKWAVDNGFPATFQVLCHNHNTKKERERYRGISPSAGWFRKAKLEALAVYGEQCACCGEADFDMLQFDHIAGGGRRHRAALKIVSVAVWARKHGWPPMFRTLCANCNFSAHLGAGTCAHQRTSLTIRLEAAA